MIEFVGLDVQRNQAHPLLRGFFWKTTLGPNLGMTQSSSGNPLEQVSNGGVIHPEIRESLHAEFWR